MCVLDRNRSFFEFNLDNRKHIRDPDSTIYPASLGLPCFRPTERVEMWYRRSRSAFFAWGFQGPYKGYMYITRPYVSEPIRVALVWIPNGRE